MSNLVAARKYYERVLLVGHFGSGKSTQIYTLPGRKLVYCFDPNSEACLSTPPCPQATLVPMLPATGEIDIWPRNIKSHVSSIDRVKPELYERFLKDVDSRNWENDYDWMIVDGISFLARTMMSSVKVLQQRISAQDHRTNYQIVGNMLVDVFNYLPNFPVNVLATSHYRKDENSASPSLDAPGSARDQLPKEFNQIWSLFTVPPAKQGERSTYWIQTSPSEDLPLCRTSIKPPPDFQTEVSITDWSEGALPKQGIGKILTGMQAPTAPANL